MPNSSPSTLVSTTEYVASCQISPRTTAAGTRIRCATKSSSQTGVTHRISASPKKIATLSSTSRRVAPANGGNVSVVDCERGIDAAPARRLSIEACSLPRRFHPEIAACTPLAALPLRWMDVRCPPIHPVAARVHQQLSSRVGSHAPCTLHLKPRPAPQRASRAQSVSRTSHVAQRPAAIGDHRMLILLIVLLLVFGFGGARLGPGLGYYGGWWHQPDPSDSDHSARHPRHLSKPLQ